MHMFSVVRIPLDGISSILHFLYDKVRRVKSLQLAFLFGGVVNAISGQPQNIPKKYDVVRICPLSLWTPVLIAVLTMGWNTKQWETLNFELLFNFEKECNITMKARFCVMLLKSRSRESGGGRRWLLYASCACTPGINNRRQGHRQLQNVLLKKQKYGEVPSWHIKYFFLWSWSLIASPQHLRVPFGNAVYTHIREFHVKRGDTVFR